MAFQINRADMKLLTECGYSGLLRNLNINFTPIFDALETWMPNQGAGTIGHALESMVAGDIQGASDRLEAMIADPDRTGRSEAIAILAMCKALQKDMVAAERLTKELEGTGGHAEQFATLLTRGADEDTAKGDQGPERMVAN